MTNTPLVIGIDLGSSRFIIGFANPSGVDILVNQSSYRQTPTIIIYGEQRTTGDKALLKIKKELQNSILNPIRFAGEACLETLKTEQNFNFSSTQIMENGRVFFTLKHEGDYSVVSTEQALAAVFSEMIGLIQFNSIVAQETVVSVPSYFGQIERETILTSAKIAGLNITKLINESTANILNYSVFRRNEFEAESPRIVGFVDVGHSKSSVYFASISSMKIETISEFSDSNLGCRNMDSNILRFYSELLKKKHKIDVMGDKKMVFRFLDAIQKQRVALTINSEVPIVLESLTEDFDFTYSMKRDEFEKINADLFKNLRYLFDSCFKQLKKEQSRNLHSVERIGGGSRIPAVERLIAASFKVKTVSKTLDANESITRGCAIQAAMLSPKFHMSTYDFKEKLKYPISVKLQFDKEDTKAKTLFEVNSEYCQRLSIPITKENSVRISVCIPSKNKFEEKVIAETAIAKREKGEEVTVYFYLNHNGIVSIENAVVKNSSKEKNEKSVFSNPLPLKIKNHVEISQEDFILYRNKEFAILNKDLIAQQALSLKNQIEAFVYQVRNNIKDSKYHQLLSEADRNINLDILSKYENWLYNEGVSASVEVYRVRMAEVEQIFSNFLNNVKHYLLAEDILAEGNRFLVNFQEKAIHLEEKEKPIAERHFVEIKTIIEELKVLMDYFNLERFLQLDINRISAQFSNNMDSLKGIISRY